jgi:catalase
LPRRSLPLSQKTDVNLKVGERGPTILNDVHLREKISKFDHERIPERVVHARGAAAHGVFKLHTAIPELSRAGILTDTTRTTPVFLRFSTVAGSRGSADTVRDVRGFALRFYTDEGNWDIVGNSEWRIAGLMEDGLWADFADFAALACQTSRCSSSKMPSNSQT